MRKKVVNREYGQRTYVDGSYRTLNEKTETGMNWDYIYKNSEFKKPYMINSTGSNANYVQMEYLAPGNEGGGFGDTPYSAPPNDSPSDFDTPGGGGAIPPPGGAPPGGGYNFPPGPGGGPGGGPPPGAPGYGGSIWPGCGSVTIDPTDSVMYDSETQYLTINGTQPPLTGGFHYEIILIGAGSIWPSYGSVGDSILYTPRDIDTNYIATFRLILASESYDYGAEICDESTVLVLCGDGAWVPYDAGVSCDSGFGCSADYPCSATTYSFEGEYYYKTISSLTFQCLNPGDGCPDGPCSTSKSCYAPMTWQVCYHSWQSFRWECV